MLVWRSEIVELTNHSQRVLVRISHTPPTNVARTLVSAASRLVSTLFRSRDTLSKVTVDMAIGAVRKRASILSSHPNICEICVLLGRIAYAT